MKFAAPLLLCIAAFGAKGEGDVMGDVDDNTASITRIDADTYISVMLTGGEDLPLAQALAQVVCNKVHDIWIPDDDFASCGVTKESSFAGLADYQITVSVKSGNLRETTEEYFTATVESAVQEFMSSAKEEWKSKEVYVHNIDAGDVVERNYGHGCGAKRLTSRNENVCCAAHCSYCGGDKCKEASPLNDYSCCTGEIAEKENNMCPATMDDGELDCIRGYPLVSGKKCDSESLLTELQIGFAKCAAECEENADCNYFSSVDGKVGCTLCSSVTDAPDGDEWRTYAVSKDGGTTSAIKKLQTELNRMEMDESPAAAAAPALSVLLFGALFALAW